MEGPRFSNIPMSIACQIHRYHQHLQPALLLRGEHPPNVSRIREPCGVFSVRRDAGTWSLLRILRGIPKLPSGCGTSRCSAVERAQKFSLGSTAPSVVLACCGAPVWSARSTRQQLGLGAWALFLQAGAGARPGKLLQGGRTARPKQRAGTLREACRRAIHPHISSPSSRMPSGVAAAGDIDTRFAKVCCNQGVELDGVGAGRGRAT